MGIEYRIACPPESVPKLGEFLRRVGGLPCSQFPEQIEFRFRPSTPDQMPDVTVIVEAQGVYFCDHCGEREPVAVLFRRISDEALTHSGFSGSVVVASL